MIEILLSIVLIVLGIGFIALGVGLLALLKNIDDLNKRI